MPTLLWYWWALPTLRTDHTRLSSLSSRFAPIQNSKFKIKDPTDKSGGLYPFFVRSTAIYYVSEDFGSSRKL